MPMYPLHGGGLLVVKAEGSYSQSVISKAIIIEAGFMQFNRPSFKEVWNTC